MLDDTLQESIGTHFPLTWRDTLQNYDNTAAFFAIALTPNLTEDIYVLCLQCLSELASCRISIFESLETRKNFVHRFSQNLSELIKMQSDYFCSSRMISRHYIKIFYKLEMNFQLRSFGLKDPRGVEILKLYLSDLAEFTILLIKSGQSYLRDGAIHLLAAWNRINIEMADEALIKEKIKDIIVEYIEQNISDLSDDQDDAEEEQFSENELSNLTQRFDIIARLFNIHIETAFNSLNEGLGFLMNKYEQEVNNKNSEM